MNFWDEFRSGKWIPNTIAICSGVILYLALTHIGIIGVAFSSIWTLIAPLVLGVVLAYIMDPAVKFLEKKGLRRKPAVIATLIILIVAAILLAAAVLPQLVSGFIQFLDSLSGYITSLERQLSQLGSSQSSALTGSGVLSGSSNLTGSSSSLTESISGVLNSISDYLSANSIVSTSSGLSSGVGTFLIGFIFAIYFLMGKAEILTWVKGFLQKILKPDRYAHLAAFWKRCNSILLSYISCSLIEALIVGLVNLVFMIITGMPYASVISFIVGITNLAPTFGPIIGCILGMFILLLVKPKAVIAFLIFTLILQTIDGYVIKPRLFGNTLGVSPLLILIVLVLGGRIFGVWGLLLAIPFAAILQYLFQEILFPYTNTMRQNAIINNRRRLGQKKRSRRKRDEQDAGQIPDRNDREGAEQDPDQNR